MRQSDATEINRLVQKLQAKDDVSLEEADRIFSLLSKNMLKTKLNPGSSKADRDLMNALRAWFDVVAEKVEQGKRGNFIFTIILTESLPRNLRGPYSFIYELQQKARTKLERYGHFEDLFTKLLIDRKIYSSLPKELQKLFSEETDDLQYKGFHVLHSPRANMYHYPVETESGTYTIARLMERFSPVMKTRNYYLGRVFFETASGIYDILMDSWQQYRMHARESTIAQCLPAAYMKYKEFPFIAMLRPSTEFHIIFEGDIVFFTEKDKTIIVKDVLEIPFEDVVKNALNEKIIDEETARDMIRDKPLPRFPVKEFMETSARYVDNVLRMQRELETAKRAVKNEEEWLEMTR
jgi:hypothetical protein